MNNEDLAGASVSPEEKAPNLVQRVIMVFLSPGKLGELIRGRSPWFWTLVIVAVISAVAWLLLPVDLLRQTIEMQAAARPQAQQPDAETAVRMARIFGPISVLVMTFVAAAVIAGVLYLAFDVALGQETTFKQHLSAAAHIYWINFVGFLVLIPIWAAKGDMQIALGLGLLLPEAPSSFGGYLLNSITIFGLWSTSALGAIESGLSGGRVTVGKAISVTLLLYLLWVVLNALRATFMGG
jgi:hypothetical protein